MKSPLTSSGIEWLSVSIAGMNTFLSSLFQLFVIYRLGVGKSSDLYYGATIATVVVFTIFLDPLSNILIPMFVEKAAEESQENAILLWNSVLAVFAGGIAVILVIYAPIRFTFPFLFKSLRWVDSAEVGRIVIAYSVYQILFGAVMVKNCFLFASGKPVAAQTNTLTTWIVSLLLLWRVSVASDVSRIAYCLAVGNVAGLVLPNLGRGTVVYHGKYFRSHITSLIRRAAPLTSGSAIFKAESLLDGAIASFSGVGGLTIYQLFSRMLLSVSTVINSGYIQPVTKHFAEAAGQRRWQDLGRQAQRAAFLSSAASLVVLAPLAPVLLFLHARPIPALQVYVQIFDRHYGVLVLMLGYLVGSLIWKVYANGLFVIRKERVFAVVCLTTFPVGACLKIAGAYSAGLAGLALGTSLYWIVGSAAMAASFWKYLGECRNVSWNQGSTLSPGIVSKLGAND